MVCSASEFTDLAGLICAHRPGLAAGQDRRRDHKRNLVRDETHVQHPHAAVVALAGDEGASAIDNTGYLSGPFR
jgi:hypothetical protein